MKFSVFVFLACALWGANGQVATTDPRETTFSGDYSGVITPHTLVSDMSGSGVLDVTDTTSDITSEADISVTEGMISASGIGRVTDYQEGTYGSGLLEPDFTDITDTDDSTTSTTSDTPDFMHTTTMANSDPSDMTTTAQDHTNSNYNSTSIHKTDDPKSTTVNLYTTDPVLPTTVTHSTTNKMGNTGTDQPSAGEMPLYVIGIVIALLIVSGAIIGVVILVYYCLARRKKVVFRKGRAKLGMERVQLRNTVRSEFEASGPYAQIGPAESNTSLNYPHPVDITGSTEALLQYSPPSECPSPARSHLSPLPHHSPNLHHLRPPPSPLATKHHSRYPKPSPLATEAKRHSPMRQLPTSQLATPPPIICHLPPSPPANKSASPGPVMHRQQQNDTSESECLTVRNQRGSELEASGAYAEIGPAESSLDFSYPVDITRSIEALLQAPDHQSPHDQLPGLETLSNEPDLDSRENMADETPADACRGSQTNEERDFEKSNVYDTPIDAMATQPLCTEDCSVSASNDRDPKDSAALTLTPVGCNESSRMSNVYETPVDAVPTPDIIIVNPIIVNSS